MSQLFEELISMDLEGLVSRFVTDPPQPGDLPPSAWDVVLSRLCTMVWEESDQLDADEWPVVTRAVETALHGEQESGERMRWEVVARRLNLTASILRRVQPANDGSIRDPLVAARLFLAEVPVSQPEAQRLSVGWRERDIETIRRLRWAKNLIASMEYIAPLIEDADVNATVRRWVQLWPLLP